jgi:hypothetical protein
MTKMIPVDVDALTLRVSKDLPPKSSASREVGLLPVRSYVVHGKTLQSSTFAGVAVPSFAVHWGVVVGKILYHLVFKNRQDSELAWSDTSRYGPIRLAITKWERDTDSADLPALGHTKFGSEELMEIGDKLIDAFGDYHRLFWNCQVFAESFLRLITENKNSGFGRWTGSILNSYGRCTSVDASQLFLCAFVVTLPTATTLKVAYEVKRKALESAMQDVIELLSEVEEVSQQDGMGPYGRLKLKYRRNYPD